MKKEDIEDLVNTMKQYHPYDDDPCSDPDCYCDSDYRRGYEDGYSRGWTTVMLGLKTELRDDKYTVKPRRSRK